MIKIIDHEYSVKATKLGPIDDDLSEAVTLLTCDERFAFYTQVTLLSLFLHSTSRNFETAILATNITPESISGFGRLAESFNRSLTVLEVSPESSPHLGSYFHIPRVAHLRFIAPHIIGARSIAYLDSDCLVQTDFGGIFREHRPELLLGAVEDPFRSKAVEYLGEEGCRPYINSGVLLFTPILWRKSRALERSVRYFEEHEAKLVMKQQDALNGALADEKYAISPKWNITVQSPTPEYEDKPYVVLARAEGVVHFSGRIKPWSKWCDKPIRDYYLSFAKLLQLS